jgi:hypothetical protein
MTKDKKVDYSKLNLGSKMPIVKPAVIEEVLVPKQAKVPSEKPSKKSKDSNSEVAVTPVEKLVEKAVTAIHAPENIEEHIEKERTLRVTLDIPLSLHAEIRTFTFRKGISMKEYFLELAKKDIGLI